MITFAITDKIFKFIKVFLIVITTDYSTRKVIDKKKYQEEKYILTILLNIFISMCYYFLRDRVGLAIATIFLIMMLGLNITKDITKNIAYATICVSISLTINNILYFLSSAVTYIPCMLLNIQNIHISAIIINLLYMLLVFLFFNIKKMKYGFAFLKTSINNGYFEILFFNISSIILFTVILLINAKGRLIINKTGVYLVILSVMMFITIQKSLQLYYKQKLLAQELENTNKELADKTKEIQELEAENISISKKAHTLDHKQKSLAKKIDELMMSTEISKEEATEVSDRLNKIGKELYKEKTIAELAKTEIPEIDDMLTYMQSECSANKIDFELQLKGNIYYMINNLITKEDLETLLADHIKNAIIAINHTDNINRSILVRLGEIDGTYGLYIYDSGIEFTKETLENLGKKPSTTHADEGGTGMGFMNTFDTLRKCKASLTIEEFNEPNKDNYTKAIIIRFDNKNEFKIKSYRYNKTRK